MGSKVPNRVNFLEIVPVSASIQIFLTQKTLKQLKTTTLEVG